MCIRDSFMPVTFVYTHSHPQLYARISLLSHTLAYTRTHFLLSSFSLLRIQAHSLNFVHTCLYSHICAYVLTLTFVCTPVLALTFACTQVLIFMCVYLSSHRPLCIHENEDLTCIPLLTRNLCILVLTLTLCLTCVYTRFDTHKCVYL